MAEDRPDAAEEPRYLSNGQHFSVVSIGGSLILHGDPDLLERQIGSDLFGQGTVVPPDPLDDIACSPHPQPEIVVSCRPLGWRCQSAPSHEKALCGRSVFGGGAEQLADHRIADRGLFALDLYYELRSIKAQRSRPGQEVDPTVGTFGAAPAGITLRVE